MDSSILIVDDIFTNRLLLKEIFSQLGYHTFEAKNGKEAIEILEDNHIKVIFMDIEMPVMNGLETTIKIRERADKKKDVPIIALTAHNPALFFSDFSTVGFNDLVTKPYSLEKISSIIKSLEESDGPFQFAR